jgi:hypothetical protein
MVKSKGGIRALFGDPFIRWAATAPALVRAQRFSLNSSQSQRSISVSKPSILSFTGEIHQNNLSPYISERRIPYTHIETRALSFPCPDWLQFG